MLGGRPARYATARTSFRPAMTEIVKQSLGLEQCCGSLQPEMKGDVIIVDLNSHPRNIGAHDILSQIVHIAQSADVTHTIVGGEVLMDEKRIVSLNEQSVIEKSRDASNALMRRIG